MCDSHDKNAEASEVYAACKDWCDEYFTFRRDEHRGVGGVFFDDLEDDAGSGSDSARVRGVTDAESFTRAIADEWLDSYLPIVDKRRDEAYGEAQERWHHQRRGRYIEFNLLYDRGVRFGLDGGRIEAIMVSARLAFGGTTMSTPSPDQRSTGSWRRSRASRVDELKT